MEPRSPWANAARGKKKKQTAPNSERIQFSSNTEVGKPLFRVATLFSGRLLTLLLDENMRSGSESQAKFDISGRAVEKKCRRLVYRGESGRAMVRHMWATGLLSLPRPSLGCLKWRPTMSTNGSTVTTALGSKAYKSFTVTSRGSMYHLWFLSIL